jgi:dTDP-4-amino-4,6-dideoxygalactose transaminase
MERLESRNRIGEGRADAATGMTELETRLCAYIGAPYSVSVGSATTGLLLALKAAGIKDGAGVLCTNFSYFATADVIELAGGQPVFVDINPNTYCMDPYCLEYVVGKYARRELPIPKALIAADFFGLPASYGALEEICGKHGILLIEDMAQYFGATCKGRKTGSFGQMAVASFFPTRPLHELGEGGAVFCHTARDADRLRSLRRVLGSTGSSLDTVQASIAAEKLGSFDQELARRRAVAEHYRRRLDGAVKLQQITEGCQSACTHFAIALKSARLRESLMERLLLRHIPCSVFELSPPGRREASSFDKAALVNAQSVAQRILLIPMHPYLSARVVDYICDQILEEVGAVEAAEVVEV